MNKLKFLAIFVVLVWLGACGKDNSESHLGDYTILAGYSEEDYPTDTDTWEITDSEAATTDFAGLSAAIQALSGSGREISLKFPNLDTIPNYAIFGTASSTSMSSTPLDALASVSATKATSVGKQAFSYCTALISIDMPAATYIKEGAFSFGSSLESASLPSVTVIDEHVFYDCLSLEELYLATNSGVVLEDIDYTAFYSPSTYFSSTEDIALTLGSSNSSYMSGSTLTINDFSATFKSITLE